MNVYDKDFNLVCSYSNANLEFPTVLFLKDKDLLVICGKTNQLFCFGEDQTLKENWELPDKTELTAETYQENPNQNYVSVVK